MEKPRIGIFSLTGCGGDQLMILNLEDELLDLLSHFDIKSFQEASSYEETTELDIAFVEGSVSTKTDLERLKEIRNRCKLLIALGDCAIDGCVQAMRNQQMTIAEKMRKVYGVEEDYYDVLEPKGLAAHVKVDIKIPGCPIEKTEVLHAIISLLHGDMPEAIDYPVCVECKLNEYPCVIIEKDMPCLGPITTAGCDARCPGLGLDCIGCRGPIKDEANAAEELNLLSEKGFDFEYIANRLRFFGGNFEEIVKLTGSLKKKIGEGGQADE
jgi:sulfhydrogenase subunit delta